MIPFAAEIAEAARELAPDHLRAWVAVLRTVRAPTPAVEADLLDARPSPGLAPTAAGLVAAWRKHAPDLSGPAVALALETAGLIEETRRAERSTVVVSGPVSPSVPVRLTSAVAAEVIRKATSRILVVSFVAYGVAEVVAELEAALNRGVEVDLVLESSRGAKGKAAADVFHILQGRARFWTWPQSSRPQSGGRISLHAKVIAADECLALLGSANLTDRALDDNIEAGVILREPESVRRLVRHFRALMGPRGPLFLSTGSFP